MDLLTLDDLSVGDQLPSYAAYDIIRDELRYHGLLSYGTWCVVWQAGDKASKKTAATFFSEEYT